MSLRDVERAMRVMVWFYNHRDALNPLMDEKIDVEDAEDDLEKVKEICPLKRNRQNCILNKYVPERRNGIKKNIFAHLRISFSLRKAYVRCRKKLFLRMS